MIELNWKYWLFEFSAIVIADVIAAASFFLLIERAEKKREAKKRSSAMRTKVSRNLEEALLWLQTYYKRNLNTVIPDDARPCSYFGFDRFFDLESEVDLDHNDKALTSIKVLCNKISEYNRARVMPHQAFNSFHDELEQIVKMVAMDFNLKIEGRTVTRNE